MLNSVKEIHQNIGIENDMREYSFKERGRRRKETERVRGGAGCQEVVVLFGLVFWRYLWDIQVLKGKLKFN